MKNPLLKNLVNILSICFILLWGTTSCSTDDTDQSNLKAFFSFQPEEVLVGKTVNFINESSGVDEKTEYVWDFGDGNSTTNKNASHIYEEIGEGIYEVTLKVKSSNTEVAVKKELIISLSNSINDRKTLTEKLSDDKIMTCAHRANHITTPENSLSGIIDAIDKNIDMVEIDIRETKDGQLVLMHDKTINRTTNGSGNVSSYSLQELQGFKLYNTNGVLTDEKIPSLKEVLLLARGKIYIDLDISKKAKFNKVYPVVKQYGMLHQVLFYSSNRNVINTIISKETTLLPMPIIRNESDFNKYKNLDLKVVHYTNDSFNQNLVNKAKEKGWKIFMNVYINSNTTPTDDNYFQVNRVKTLEGNIIQTDFPVLVKRYIN